LGKITLNIAQIVNTEEAAAQYTWEMWFVSGI